MPVTSDSTSVTLTLPDSPQTSVKILNYGATAISWKVKGAEKLFVSESAKLDGSKAVRGGIPLVFPRFGPASGNHPATDKLPQHGFARNTTWEFLGEVDPSTVQFGLGPEQLDAETRKQWGYDFTLIATFSLVSPNELSVKLDVENTDKKPFDFNVLFHTYFRVPEVEEVSVDGLTNLKFYNKVANKDEESGAQPLTIHEETDRVYKDSPTTAAINAAGKPQFTVTNSKELTDTVVWNPWTSVEKLSDFSPKDGFHNMICVEKGNVNGFTTIEPGQKWTGSMILKSHI